MLCINNCFWGKLQYIISRSFRKVPSFNVRHFFVYKFYCNQNQKAMFQELLQEILKYLLLFLVIYTFVTYRISPVRTFGNVHSRWHKTFKLQFSTQEIYDSITEAIKGTGIDRTEIDIVQHSSNTSFFSANRLYLHP
jgi:hypothetical protein